jgi:hypothetical protein
MVPGHPAVLLRCRYNITSTDRMTPSAIGLASFVVVFGGALVGVFAARALPEHHLSDKTRTVVSLSMAVVGTLSALVLGLMISTASRAFATQSREVVEISVDLIRMERMMHRYGPDANDVRAKLRVYAAAKTQELFPVAGEPPQTDEATAEMLEAMQDAILALAPTDEMHRWLRSKTLALTENLSQARWLLAEQAGNSIPVPFLIMLVFWLTIVFASFGLFAPLNGTAIASLCLCSMAVSGGIMVILELDLPISGLVHISGEPMRQALTQILH